MCDRCIPQPTHTIRTTSCTARHSLTKPATGLLADHRRPSPASCAVSGLAGVCRHVVCTCMPPRSLPPHCCPSVCVSVWFSLPLLPLSLAPGGSVCVCSDDAVWGLRVDLTWCWCCHGVLGAVCVLCDVCAVSGCAGAAAQVK